MTATPTVFVGMPCHSRRVDIGAARALFQTPCRVETGIRVMPRHAQGSLLANVFNTLWVQALRLRGEMGFTHFAMIHADVEPEPWWLETLLGELQHHNADVVSAVVPLKDSRGLTSTGGLDPHHHDRLVRRLTLTELESMPETFGAADLPWPGYDLMVNTGLWVCDFTRPWVDEVAFRIDDAIVRRDVGGGQGLPFAMVDSEDWIFSSDLARRGCKVMATRKVRLRHFGEMGFSSDAGWGSWETDQDYLSIKHQGFVTSGHSQGRA